ncbi:transposase [Ruegeria sp. 2205SS24-7]|uniref:transposase n=1 Tax=Ruegeria discodermiae TaxID=3064389 RepID=UPI002741987E|nr:transposase [Ruegeria sp. 2205SS24-7]MDP5220920.1 transposase [Ruegeria sp. 2205SS24-7]
MPDLASGILGTVRYQFLGIHERIQGYAKMIAKHALLDAGARCLMRIPGVGQISASSTVATNGDSKQFRTSCDLATWLGLTLSRPQFQ